MSETLGLKNINMLSKEQFEGISDVASDELFAISGSGVGFPSNRYDELELGASGTEYTAPANGYFYINKTTASTNQYVTMYNSNKGYADVQQPYLSGADIKFRHKAQKGDVVTVVYNATGTTNCFRFIYAEGE